MHSLGEEGISAFYYHAGLRAAEREEIQDKFMSGDAEVIIATNAFGMGIDKADIRFVYHHEAPESLDSYYQEIGRAGRDGAQAEAILFFREQDIGAQAFRTGQGKVDAKQLEQVVETIAEQDQPVAPKQIAEETSLSTRKLTGTLQRLEDVGLVETLPTGAVQLTESADLEEAVQAIAELQEQRKEMNKERLEQMREYADTSACRREYLLHYFGDNYHGPCQNCDNCEAANPDIAVDPSVGTRREVA
jgi:ATP-dependent DNA helicase RecQ